MQRRGVDNLGAPFSCRIPTVSRRSAKQEFRAAIGTSRGALVAFLAGISDAWETVKDEL